MERGTAVFPRRRMPKRRRKRSERCGASVSANARRAAALERVPTESGNASEMQTVQRQILAILSERAVAPAR